MPVAARQIVEKAIKNWDSLFATHVTAVSWDFEGKITTQTQRTDVVTELTDPAKVWMLTGNPAIDTSVSADPITGDPSITKAQLDSFHHVIEALVKVGQYTVRIHWQKGTQNFTTLCVTNDTSIVYDNMLSTIRLIPKFPVNGLTVQTKTCVNLIIPWIWVVKAVLSQRNSRPIAMLPVK